MTSCSAFPSSRLAEWRFPDASDIVDDWQIYRKKDRVPYNFSADFNGDSHMDEAWILLAKDNSAWGVFVFLNVGGSDRRIIELERLQMNIRPQSMGIQPALPGYYVSACAKEYGSGCQKSEKEFVKLEYPGIEFFTYESANSIWYWNEASKNFEQIWISD